MNKRLRKEKETRLPSIETRKNIAEIARALTSAELFSVSSSRNERLERVSALARSLGTQHAVGQGQLRGEIDFVFTLERLCLVRGPKTSMKSTSTLWNGFR